MVGIPHYGAVKLVSFSNDFQRSNYLLSSIILVTLLCIDVFRSHELGLVYVEPVQLYLCILFLLFLWVQYVTISPKTLKAPAPPKGPPPVSISPTWSANPIGTTWTPACWETCCLDSIWTFSMPNLTTKRIKKVNIGSRFSRCGLSPEWIWFKIHLSLVDR